ncbi:LytR/AlgR family response regulator transcription factor [Rhodoferax mekongensis]|uniref:LytR/AlgR family response regulator transcription factor n=1 Tax=Rhodoferax mekongensis TaxID=3068341 RepID=UPI0028BD593E|nr:LytTR family DNA-binding domain-containing protein [Rhodoferax sp. TBRC 17199]MDT7514883.1 LytTR family DNA-binding domain-containing protein [Rhodoferax sp. TBRC 17199]
MPTALIAEDEPLLAQALQAELARAWPELQMLRTVGDGASAVKAALELVPQLLFFDIRMPGLSGLDAALELADRWPPAHAPQQPFPALVFVTAYDQYAVQAFEAQAVDYLLKPVQPARLQKTVSKLQLALAESARKAPETIANPATDPALEAALSQLRGLLQAHTGMPAQAADAGGTTPLLQVLQVSAGSQIRMVPIEEVLYFEAADKYVRVLTRDREHLLRTALKDLLPQLDPQVFWQVHRGTVVRATAIDTVSRDDAGRLSLSLRNRDDKLAVSRLYAQRFKAM